MNYENAQVISVDAVMFDSKKKKKNEIPLEEKEYEETEKGKQVEILVNFHV